jgi:hypothetical protein
MLQLVEDVQDFKQIKWYLVLLIKPMINIVFISEFLAAVSHVSFSLFYPVIVWHLRDLEAFIPNVTK